MHALPSLLQIEALNVRNMAPAITVTVIPKAELYWRIRCSIFFLHLLRDREPLLDPPTPNNISLVPTGALGSF
jgi:hypothetical protein